MSDEIVKNVEKKGAFLESLKRNNRKIREDRALSIAEDAEIIYKRTVEDLQIRINKLRRDQESALDLSPTDVQSLVLASDFKADEFVSKDLNIQIEIRTTEIKLECAQKRYNYLFGGE